jgi:hypothetical protein
MFKRNIEYNTNDNNGGNKRPNNNNDYNNVRVNRGWICDCERLDIAQDGSPCRNPACVHYGTNIFNNF